MSTRRTATALVTALALVTLAACGGDDDSAADDTTADDTAADNTAADDTAADDTAADDTAADTAGTTDGGTATTADDTRDTTGGTGGEEIDLSELGATLSDGEYGENYTPDPELVITGLAGPHGLPSEERARNIVLAAIDRAGTAVDEDLAFECWQNDGCDTGTGGELKVALADGFGGNIARQIFKMEFILQALTYPEIGEIAYTDANLDTQKAISDVRSFAARDFDVIISFPDAGDALVPAYRAATEQGAKVVTWSSGSVGEPGSDYLTYSGPDWCQVGRAWGTKLGEELPDGGKIAILLGAPGNTLDAQQEECMLETLPDNIEIVARQGDAWSREGYLQATSAILAEHPDIDGLIGSYGDAFVGAMRAFEAAGVPMDGLVTMHQGDDNPLLCAWKEAGGVMRSFTGVSLLMEGRTGLTAAMMSRAGYDVPSEIIFGVQLKPITMDSCRTDIPPDGSSSSLVSGELQSRMFPG